VSQIQPRTQDKQPSLTYSRQRARRACHLSIHSSDPATCNQRTIKRWLDLFAQDTASECHAQTSEKSLFYSFASIRKHCSSRFTIDHSVLGINCLHLAEARLGLHALADL
jgi:hypothetical protein